MGRLVIGETAPDFEATAHDANDLTLSGLTDGGPVVLSLLRGLS